MLTSTAKSYFFFMSTLGYFFSGEFFCRAEIKVVSFPAVQRSV